MGLVSKFQGWRADQSGETANSQQLSRASHEGDRDSSLSPTPTRSLSETISPWGRQRPAEVSVSQPHTKEAVARHHRLVKSL